MEKQNRAVFDSNQEINHAIIYPIAKAYNDNIPEDVRDRIDRLHHQPRRAVVFANDVLQLRFAAAATTLGRFASIRRWASAACLTLPRPQELAASVR